MRGRDKKKERRAPEGQDRGQGRPRPEGPAARLLAALARHQEKRK